MEDELTELEEMEAFMGPYRNLEEGEDVDLFHRQTVHGSELLVPTRLYGHGSSARKENSGG